MIPVPKKLQNPYLEEENIIRLYRGAVIPFKELMQFDRQKGKVLFSNFLMSTSTQLAQAKNFAKVGKNHQKLPEGMVKVLFKIAVDMNYTNDYGTYIADLSDAGSEEEWLISFGSRFIVTSDVYQAIKNQTDEDAFKKLDIELDNANLD